MYATSIEEIEQKVKKVNQKNFYIMSSFFIATELHKVSGFYWKKSDKKSQTLGNLNNVWQLGNKSNMILRYKLISSLSFLDSGKVWERNNYIHGDIMNNFFAVILCKPLFCKPYVNVV